MAEGLLRHLYGDRLQAYSAGLAPSRVHPLAVKAMAEIGIDISKQRSKSIQEFLGERFDVVVTVCDEAKEACPFFPRASKQLHWSFPDPSEAKGRREEVLKVFRKVRDAIKDRVSVAVESRELDNGGASY